MLLACFEESFICGHHEHTFCIARMQDGSASTIKLRTVDKQAEVLKTLAESVIEQEAYDQT